MSRRWLDIGGGSVVDVDAVTAIRVAPDGPPRVYVAGSAVGLPVSEDALPALRRALLGPEPAPVGLWRQEPAQPGGVVLRDENDVMVGFVPTYKGAGWHVWAVEDPEIRTSGPESGESAKRAAEAALHAAGVRYRLRGAR